MRLRSTLRVLNGFLHDFAAGYWLAAMVVIVMLHHRGGAAPQLASALNGLQRDFFWQSVGAALVIGATGAGRTFTYVENWYGMDAEQARRRMLIVKHLVLAAAFGTGYCLVWGMVFKG